MTLFKTKILPYLGFLCILSIIILSYRFQYPFSEKVIIGLFIFAIPLLHQMMEGAKKSTTKLNSKTGNYQNATAVKFTVISQKVAKPSLSNNHRKGQTTKSYISL